jgi:hypothetical protein
MLLSVASRTDHTDLLCLRFNCKLNRLKYWLGVLEDEAIRRDCVDLCKIWGQMSTLQTGKTKLRTPAYLPETKLAALLYDRLNGCVKCSSFVRFEVTGALLLRTSVF